MNWLTNNWHTVLDLAGAHLVQSVLPVVLGLLVSVPLARLAAGSRWLRPLLVTGSSLLYTIPSLTLFVVLPLVLGTRMTSVVNVIVALTLYVVAILVRSCVDAFESLDRDVLQAATAMGYRPARRFFGVELPLAVPVMVAGLRVATVSNISMVSVGAVIGIQSLGTLFTDGLRRSIVAEILVGIVATVLIAVVLDQLLRLLGQVLTRWQRPGTGAREAGGRRRRDTHGRGRTAGGARDATGALAAVESGGARA
ncbi:ABC transporter permease [Glutamicibacter protophormiae]|uniref:Choline transport system permease protein OpuBD n=2 Tax=Kocuria TaxID=57493 RepID=A0A7D7Q2I9_KOCVA|nr:MULTISPECIES: ABC transporter permease [Kocuria]MDN5630564.1 ABC transporter permease [Kocuria sp.]QMS55957.1 Choline transport system permease protein OpuBD [Kocuria varians]RUP85297.1 ABC transporter permease [Kocuria sp. HSID17590]WNB88492.1 ABC transporter permease [Glutamicibacter protophormiae]